jgi:hypothetical protein
MIDKLDNYLSNLFTKRAPICATILDPRFKLNFFQNHFDSMSVYGITTKDLRARFVSEAEKFSQPEELSSSVPSLSTFSSLEDNLFGYLTYKFPSIHSEIARYLAEPLERRDIKVLDYWNGRQTTYPCLALMARTFLAIPATSTPSERVFSGDRGILGSQCSSTKPEKLEMILCVKECYRVFGPLYNAAVIV